ncbi:MULTISPECIES: cysteine metabolism transcriptional regulator CymR [Mammaliicoccus]|uniref:cysteine metabolism transcriptional regulator CymR n=1 Tax=Mammaliicoccus TaxID=2803850 RepID=UPI000CD0EEB7|nr:MULTISPECIES: Rrf2 family transcriptional regulator [Mammaliicoccus]HBV03751.1 Rrf2 family transcriptional regulator [Staphylococcus sp.]MBF0793511.1 Rrf2 family transcriptional regulator [Mammaliicoccus lentus]MDQ7141858.1 Rrf2 family transcriptional regulator [Mammaliicoccus lentus]POA06429.1 transcriptional regulator [Mammaliicoccus lentus]TFV18005.1 Rrf2 family transcriptional regulator [Mammaliicoccus lentus]
MKISTKGRYGLTLMISLTKRYGQGCTSLKSIAEENNLSDLYLEQLVGPLRNAGLIKSVRGAKGGYELQKSPSEITAGDVIRLLEGPITLVEGIEDEPPAQQQLWIRIRDAVKEVLDNTTLEYLANYTKQDELEGYMFYI